MPLEFGGKKIQVHADFRMFFVNSKHAKETSVPAELNQKLFCFVVDNEDERRWKSVFSDIMLSYFHITDRDTAITARIKDVEDRQNTIDQ